MDPEDSEKYSEEGGCIWNNWTSPPEFTYVTMKIFRNFFLVNYTCVAATCWCQGGIYTDTVYQELYCLVKTFWEIYSVSDRFVNGDFRESFIQPVLLKQI